MLLLLLLFINNCVEKPLWEVYWYSHKFLYDMFAYIYLVYDLFIRFLHLFLTNNLNKIVYLILRYNLWLHYVKQISLETKVGHKWKDRDYFCNLFKYNRVLCNPSIMLIKSTISLISPTLFFFSFFNYIGV